jgi:DnaK suppressor protein
MTQQSQRYEGLRGLLNERRDELRNDIGALLHEMRAEGSLRGGSNEVLDTIESSGVAIQTDIIWAIIQMKSDTLHRVDDALARLEQGDYGYCFGCGEEIAEKRLRALPFAVLCKDCEEARENAERRERRLAQRRGLTPSLFLDM